MFDKLRDPVSGLTHLGAAIAAAVGSGLLLWLGRDRGPTEIALAVYGVSLVLMFAASAVYHLLRTRPRVDRALRKLDHAAIYLLIAGTYTPICLHYFRGFWQWGMLTIIWTMAVVGVSVKVFVIKAPRRVTAGLYVLMGWFSIIAVKEIVSTMPAAAIVWLVLGGVFFTVGAGVYVAKKPNVYPGVFGFHELWHVFVILGCACHFIVIAAFVAAAGVPT